MLEDSAQQTLDLVQYLSVFEELDGNCREQGGNKSLEEMPSNVLNVGNALQDNMNKNNLKGKKG